MTMAANEAKPTEEAPSHRSSSSSSNHSNSSSSSNSSDTSSASSSTSSYSSKLPGPPEELEAKLSDSEGLCDELKVNEENDKDVPKVLESQENMFIANDLFSHNSPCPSEDGFEGFSSPARERKTYLSAQTNSESSSKSVLNLQREIFDTCESEEEKIDSSSSDYESDHGESHSDSAEKICESLTIKNDGANLSENDKTTQELANDVPKIEICERNKTKLSPGMQSVEQMTKAAIGEVVEALDDDTTGEAVKLPNNVIKKIIEKKEELLIEGPSKLSIGSLLCTARKNDASALLKSKKISLNPDMRLGIDPNLEPSSSKLDQNSLAPNDTELHSSLTETGKSITIPKSTTENSLKTQGFSPNDFGKKLFNGTPDHIKPHTSCPTSSEEDEEEEQEETDKDGEPPLPIQAEVVMSEGSDSESQAPNEKRKNFSSSSNLLRPHEFLNNGLNGADISELLRSYVGGDQSGEMVQFHPSSNALPKACSNLSLWQLDSVKLPAFVPSQKTPDWIRVTIPPEGYKCHSCGDTFFLDSSRESHMQRRSLLINLECGPCDARLTFYNRCALREHLRMHIMKGEDVDDDTVEVRSLPVHMTPLLQPYVVPVPRVTDEMTRSVGENDGVVQTKNSSCDRMLRCFMCDRMFYSIRELMAHMRTDQAFSDKRVECRKCQLILPSVCAAKAHILTHPPTNETNISVCPECGSLCESPRDFVHHINTCGHHYRRSGIICSECHVCFFRSDDEFLSHWIKEHCNKSYECSVCSKRFESLVFHSCSTPGQQVLSAFKCVLDCPLCDESVLVDTLEHDDIHFQVREHLDKSHTRTINRVHYVYKSKFCSNAFRSKDELRAHHEREHRRDNHYRTKSCSLHHTVVAAQQKYSITANEVRYSEQRGALVSLPILLSAEEQEETRLREIPTVSCILDKDLFPEMPSAVDPLTGQRVTVVDGVKVDALTGEVLNAVNSDTPKSRPSLDDGFSPYVCYRCGLTHSERKKHKRHVRNCTGEMRDRTCRVCHNSFRGENFVLHCRYHMQQGIILCMFCNAAQFESMERLHSHFEKHAHEQFVYPAVCPFCSIVMPDVASSLSHLIDKHAFLMNLSSNNSNNSSITAVSSSQPVIIAAAPEAFVPCERCGRKFQGGRALSVHSLSCHTSGSAAQLPNTRQCLACKRVLTPETIGKHMAGHLQDGFIVCSLCDGKPIASSGDLLEHLEEHVSSLSYPYSCIMCQLKLEDPQDALEHLKEEHGLGHLACPECDMNYTFSQQLARHTEIVHRVCQYSKRRYICWICRAYDHVKKETLMNHFSTAHGLERSQVNEKIMIRTRGQGTMPTSQFVPTKQINKKKSSASDKFPDEAQARSFCEVSPTGGSINSSPETKPPTIVKDTSPPATKLTSPAATPSSSSASVSPPEKSSIPIIPQKVTDTKNTQKIIRVDIKEALIKPQVTKVRIEEATNSTVVKPAPKVNVTISTNLAKTNTNIQPTVSISPLEVGVKRKLDTSSDGENSSGVSVSSDLSSTSSNLKKKKKTHQCNSCSFATNFREKLERHKQRQHGSPVTGFLCQECGQSFVVQQSLVRHMFFDHKIKWQSDLASRSESPDVKQLENPDEQPKQMVCLKRPAGQLVLDSNKMRRLSNNDRPEDRKTMLSNLPKVTARGLFGSTRPDSNKVIVTQSSIIRVERSKSVDGAPTVSKIIAKPIGEKGFVSAPCLKSVSVVSFGINSGVGELPKTTLISGDGKIHQNQSTSKTIVVGKPLQVQSSIVSLRPPVKISCSSLGSNASEKSKSASALTFMNTSNSPADSSPIVSVRLPYVSLGSPPGASLVSTSNALKSASDSSAVVLPNQSKISVTNKSQPPPRSSSAPIPQSANSIVTMSASIPEMPDIETSASGAPTSAESIEDEVVTLDDDANEESYECGVCNEEFSSVSEQYSHMRTHGMAFLQIGRKHRALPAPGVSSTKDENKEAELDSP
ncbi:uncharacterized protein LOC108664990 [Hyalella azteca]|uniref:Uncharacterized protein LOC108664990 n=1 Tax=Hyalella azteca TaxID=294128 RepID=A0A8B7N0W8_HYAAZ|nr:uncharacterized protein LOC108664990 [Hyalella azteca]